MGLAMVGLLAAAPAQAGNNQSGAGLVHAGLALGGVGVATIGAGAAIGPSGQGCFGCVVGLAGGGFIATGAVLAAPGTLAARRGLLNQGLQVSGTAGYVSLGLLAGAGASGLIGFGLTNRAGMYFLAASAPLVVGSITASMIQGGINRGARRRGASSDNTVMVRLSPIIGKSNGLALTGRW